MHVQYKWGAHVRIQYLHVLEKVCVLPHAETHNYLLPRQKACQVQMDTHVNTKLFTSYTKGMCSKDYEMMNELMLTCFAHRKCMHAQHKLDAHVHYSHQLL